MDDQNTGGNRANDGKPLVSIIIIFLDMHLFIREAIESVLAQDFTKYELILVDDGSTDGSSELARGYSGSFPGKIFYLEHEAHANEGMSASRTWASDTPGVNISASATLTMFGCPASSDSS